MLWEINKQLKTKCETQKTSLVDREHIFLNYVIGSDSKWGYSYLNPLTPAFILLGTECHIMLFHSMSRLCFRRCYLILWKDCPDLTLPLHLQLAYPILYEACSSIYCGMGYDQWTL